MAVKMEMQEIGSMAEVPDFATDEEEQEFWATHSLGDGIELKTRETSDHPLPPPRAQTTRAERVSLSLEQDTVKRLKRLAEHKGMGYQTLPQNFCERAALRRREARRRAAWFVKRLVED